MLHVNVSGNNGNGGTTVHYDVEGPEGLSGAALSRGLELLGHPALWPAGPTPLAGVASVPARGHLMLTPFPREAVARSGLPPLWLVVASGPDCGQAIALRRGNYAIGRGPCALRVMDPSISRHHADIRVSGTSITLELRPPPLSRPTTPAVRPLAVGEDFRLGSTTFRLSSGGTAPEAPPQWPQDPLNVAGPPGTGRPWLTLTGAVLPLFIGLALAMSTGSWYFLAFSMLGLFTGGIPALTELTGRRRFRRRLRLAALEDVERLELAAPPVGQLASGGCTPRRTPVIAASAGPAVPVRLGNGMIVPNIATTGRQEPGQRREVHGPVVVDVSPGTVGSLTGHPAATAGVLRSVVLQLAIACTASGSELWIIGNAYALPVELRRLPCIRVDASPTRLTWRTEAPAPGSILVILDQPPGGLDALLPANLREQHALIVVERENRATATWHLDALSGKLASGGRTTTAQLDRVSSETLSVLSSRMADSWDRSGLHGFPEPPSATGAEEQDRNGAHRQLPASVAFRVPPAPWTDSSAHSLVAALGAGHNGPVLLDFVAEGPHALIAGTTGSGKSALVTSLVLDLMCRYPPHDLAFMLIDFKGGSTLAPFGNMPHCQALVTDLGVETADRTLQGLRAEVVRRERVLKNAAAADYAQYRNAGRSSDAMPRLLVVVDEFRVLTDELPHALTELMRIATVGRSLGIHLLLATQRPQGVITGEMRANINAIVSLRLLSTFDSDELLGSGVAAEIPASAPGRGFIRKGGEAPVAFQAAHAASVHEGWRLTRVGPSLTDAGPSVHLEAPEGPATTPRGIMEKITAHRPTYTVPTPAFAPPLPDRLTAVARRFRTGQEPASIAIGLVDAVEEQCLKPLWWEPNRMPRLAIVAGPAGGAHGCLQRLVMAAARREPECHIYVLDGMNTLAGSAALPRVAGYVGADEPERVLEMLELLERAGTADAGTQRVLAVTGLAAWSVVLGGSGFIQLDDRLAALARNATSAGLAIVVVGDRDLTSSRFFPMAEHRLYCPFGLGEETVLAWPRLRPVSAVPGRAVWIGPGSPAPGVVVQLVDDAPGSTPEAPFPRPAAPLRACLPLPRELRARELRRLGSTDGTSHPADVDAGWLIGVSGPDNRAWRWSPGNLGLVLGAGGTGKTSVLRLLAAMSPGTTAVLGFSVPGTRPLADFPIEAGVGCGMPTLILVDNATELGALERSLLAQWHDRSAHIVLAALPGSQLYSMLPLPGIRPSPGGAILLNPRSAEDGNFLGWCFPPDTALLPGRALVMANGSLQRIQCALPD